MKKGRVSGPSTCRPRRLLNWLADQAGLLENRDFGLAEDVFQLAVGIDLALVRVVLQLVLLDVGPQLADHFGAGQRLVADHGRQLRAGLQRLHESGVGGALLGGSLLRSSLLRGSSLLGGSGLLGSSL